MAKAKQLTIKQFKSQNGTNSRQRDTLRSLGLGRIDSETVRDDSPQLRGMIHRVRHLVKVNENA